VLAGLTSCSKRPLEQEDRIPIAFTSSQWHPLETKADGDADFSAGDVIGVFGFYHDGNGSTDGSWSADGASNYPDFMYNQAVTKQSDGSWTYSPVKYWPNEQGAATGSEHTDKLSFWAYYPKDASGIQFYTAGSTTASYSNSTSGLPDLRFTTTDGSVDLMTSDAILDQTRPAVGTKVTFDFHHRLSWVGFSARLSSETTKIVTIKKIEILYNYNTAQLNQVPATNEVSWDNQADEQSSGIVVFNGNMDLTTSAQACGTVYLIPQPIAHSPNNVSARVTYTMSSNNVTDTFSLGVNTITELEANKKYNYSLVISPSDGLIVNLSVEPWKLSTPISEML